MRLSPSLIVGKCCAVMWLKNQVPSLLQICEWNFQARNKSFTILFTFTVHLITISTDLMSAGNSLSKHHVASAKARSQPCRQKRRPLCRSLPWSKPFSSSATFKHLLMSCKRGLFIAHPSPTSRSKRLLRRQGRQGILRSQGRSWKSL